MAIHLAKHIYVTCFVVTQNMCSHVFFVLTLPTKLGSFFDYFRQVGHLVCIYLVYIYMLYLQYEWPFCISVYRHELECLSCTSIVVH